MTELTSGFDSELSSSGFDSELPFSVFESELTSVFESERVSGLASVFVSERVSLGFESERMSSGFESERVTGLSSADRSEAEGPNRTVPVPSWLSAESENSERAKKELRVRTNLLANGRERYEFVRTDCIATARATRTIDPLGRTMLGMLGSEIARRRCAFQSICRDRRFNRCVEIAESSKEHALIESVTLGLLF